MRTNIGTAFVSCNPRRILFNFMAMAMLGPLIAPTVAAQSDTPSFAGTWVAEDCASWWEDGHLDCSVWGDQSALKMIITPADVPRVTLRDAHSADCVLNGAPTPNWVAIGAGSYEGGFLFVTFSRGGCGQATCGGESYRQLYYDPGSDTIWDDSDGDGWGITWRRG